MGDLEIGSQHDVDVCSQTFEFGVFVGLPGGNESVLLNENMFPESLGEDGRSALNRGDTITVEITGSKPNKGKQGIEYHLKQVETKE